ncbi:MAG: efflux RND transporter periplasmic adaptor subunit, partial [Ilumatobacteraceae bacterium]
MRPKRWLAVVAVAAVGGAIAVAAVAVTRTDAGTGTPDDEVDTPLAEVEKAVVERRDLVETDDFGGELGYGPETTVAGRGEGTITALSDLGSTIRRADPLWEVDGAPGPRLL